MLVIFFSRCFHDNSLMADDPRGSGYAGSKACTSCHQDIYSSYSHSNHYKTSSAVDSNVFKKPAAAFKSPFYFSDSSYIRVEEKDNALFQLYFVNGKENVSGKFDIAFGSAGKAQTYGYWKENKLYQLPLTYFADMNTWANSPGFSARHANFGRVIESRCFECHASYIDREFLQSGRLSVIENLDRNSIVYGIDCERCHGPALKHATFQQEHPSIKQSRYIASIKSLTRQQHLDVCAVCHSGNDQAKQKSLFAFTPGDTLSHFYYPDFGAGNAEPDVHGKQLQLLQLSSCFKNSTLTCTTCHTAHGPEENKMKEFIAQCVNCHQNHVHTPGIVKSTENSNCINCHMPLQSSKIIYFNNGAAAKNFPYFIRTHRIAVYH